MYHGFFCVTQADDGTWAVWAVFLCCSAFRLFTVYLFGRREERGSFAFSSVALWPCGAVGAVSELAACQCGSVRRATRAFFSHQKQDNLNACPNIDLAPLLTSRFHGALSGFSVCAIRHFATLGERCPVRYIVLRDFASTHDDRRRVFL